MFSVLFPGFSTTQNAKDTIDIQLFSSRFKLRLIDVLSTDQKRVLGLAVSEDWRMPDVSAPSAINYQLLGDDKMSLYGMTLV